MGIKTKTNYKNCNQMYFDFLLPPIFIFTKSSYSLKYHSVLLKTQRGCFLTWDNIFWQNYFWNLINDLQFANCEVVKRVRKQSSRDGYLLRLGVVQLALYCCRIVIFRKNWRNFYEGSIGHMRMKNHYGRRRGVFKKSKEDDINFLPSHFETQEKSIKL